MNCAPVIGSSCVGQSAAILFGMRATENTTARRFFWSAAGSGIAPLMAIIRHRANWANRVPTKLLYSSRSYDDIIYREELDHISANDSSLHIIHTLTRRQPPNWMSYSRRIDRAMLADTAWQPAEKPLAFTCGPTAAVETVANHLLELGYEPERIKTERFGPTG